MGNGSQQTRSSDDRGKSYWETRAVTYDSLKWPKNPDLLKDLALTVQLRDPGSILEIGCGMGSLAKLLVENKCTYVGIDISEAMVDASEKLLDGRRDAAFYEMDWKDCDVKADVVIARMVLRHEEDPAGAITQWFELVNPGGVLIVAEGPPPTWNFSTTDFYRKAMFHKHGSNRNPISAFAIGEWIFGAGARSIEIQEIFTYGNSVKNWLSGGGITGKKAKEIIELHRNASDRVKVDYKMTTKGGDVLMRWRHCTVLGLKNG